MRVILMQDIKGFGRIGDVKNVSDGHARNFLFPRKLAKAADENSTKEAESIKASKIAKGQKEKEQLNAAVSALENQSIIFIKKASPNGTLFSSISNADIAKEASTISGFKIKPEMVELDHLKKVGEHSITIDLGNGLRADIKVNIKAA